MDQFYSSTDSENIDLLLNEDVKICVNVIMRIKAFWFLQSAYTNIIVGQKILFYPYMFVFI